MDVYPCVSFLVIDQDRILLETRSADKVSDPGAINIPGGHMEKGESQQETLFRELEEELTIKPVSYTYLCSLYHPTSELQLIHYYLVSEWQGNIRAQEAEEVNWYPIQNAPLAIEADKVALAEFQRLQNHL
ncbi:NUDIX hydrolase [Vibrio sp. SCSIO 43137]|uniref:NUDIX hydrolase n=1 Tax=Vibrio sp. SCSIO 43137 TaxID=3021011 RepID=UPI00230836AE|nr:NUDIX domain-containing protein [Vibrio sp. SCSIO 43137]WCE29340.1 NUDIX domain-containing protein [Vibrio sp. SCSIO 43137]